ncbi:RT0821/Lpp0805 family surface protein [Bartonella sp. LJL80]
MCVLRKITCRQTAQPTQKKTGMKAFSLPKSRFGSLFIFVTIVLPMQGCIVAGFKADKADASFKPDASIVTGSIAPTPQATVSPVQQSDQLVVRDKISTLNKGEIGAASFNWENAVTGSEGVISQIAERKANGRLCRSFQTTRAAYDGVNLYQGQVCQVADDVWTMTAFDLVQ